MKDMTQIALFNLLFSLWQHLTYPRRLQLTLLKGLMLVSAVAEVVSLAVVLPFIGILVSPNRVFSYPIFGDVVLAWGFTSLNQLVLTLAAILATVALIAGAIRILLLWVSSRL